jgi:hypothetical protein
MAYRNELGSGTSEGPIRAIVGERLTLQAFSQLAGNLAGYPFVKVVYDRVRSRIHFINNARYAFHADYIAENLLGVPREQLERELDAYNETFYRSPDRRFYLGILALHRREDRRFLTLETVEIDTMDEEKVRFFYGRVREHVDATVPLLFKPANHPQETMMAAIPPAELPRVFSHELFASARFIALNAGTARGRLRAFRTDAEYKAAFPTIEWHDIIVMHRVPDDVPRVAGLINAHHTTPLSHTNVLASGWQIPNAIQLGIFDRILGEKLDGQWVEYKVEPSATQVSLARIERPVEANQRPAWSIQRIQLEEPEVATTPIADLDRLRVSDRYKYGTKAANLGEMRHLLEKGSERLLGFYRVRRPPRENLLPHLARFLEVAESADLSRASWRFLQQTVRVPRGIAIPFSVQQQFLESSPRIQQAIGKLKMALELNAREIDPLCLSLQQMIRATRFPEPIREAIDSRIAAHLSGVSSFVVRSSSNAEDLENFSAAGIYESINHVTTAENVFQSIKEVWASLVSPRSVRLRQQVGISLDACYMGVIVQEEVSSTMGGVLVTTNPLAKSDFRNVFVNVSARSAVEIVKGAELPFQYLYNTVEGGGRTLSLGDASEDLPEEAHARLQKLAFAGRLLQSHFSPDYTFSAPVDIEWLANDESLYVLQLRPYAK